MSSELEKVENILRDYLARYLKKDQLFSTWKVCNSPISGRGLSATQDIQLGDIVYWDRPIVLGPRIAGNAVCVGCHLESDSLEPCPNGCKLPICSPQCVQSTYHKNECTILATFGSCIPSNSSWSSELLHSLTAWRSLEMKDNDRDVVNQLQGNTKNIRELEVDVIKRIMGNKLDPKDEDWMRLCCRAFNTNAFETVKRIQLDKIEREGTVRGLYPVAALMNHECSPNTAHVFDKNHNMIVVASRPISKGEEITTSYCPLLWDTASRRLQLAKTKQFACSCERCKDPTEFGSFLSGLPCPQETCSGIVLSTNPLVPHRSNWICSICKTDIPVDQIKKLQRVQGTLLLGTDSSNPESIMNFLELKRVPHNSVVDVQLKLALCFQLGQTQNFKWEELSLKQLEIKEKTCEDIIELLKKLRLGGCRLNGIISFELYRVLQEKQKRIQQISSKDEEINDKIDKIIEKKDKTFNDASKILAKDAAAPIEFQKILKVQNQ